MPNLLVLIRQGKRFVEVFLMKPLWKMSFYEIAAAGQGVKHLEALGNFQFLVLVAVYFLKQISFLSSLLLWFLSYSFTGRNK